jgi:hypothetical protein
MCIGRSSRTGNRSRTCRTCLARTLARRRTGCSTCTRCTTPRCTLDRWARGPQKTAPPVCSRRSSCKRCTGSRCRSAPPRNRRPTGRFHTSRPARNPAPSDSSPPSCTSSSPRCRRPSRRTARRTCIARTRRRRTLHPGRNRGSSRMRWCRCRTRRPGPSRNRRWRCRSNRASSGSQCNVRSVRIGSPSSSCRTSRWSTLPRRDTERSTCSRCWGCSCRRRNLGMPRRPGRTHRPIARSSSTPRRYKRSSKCTGRPPGLGDLGGTERRSSPGCTIDPRGTSYTANTCRRCR